MQQLDQRKFVCYIDNSVTEPLLNYVYNLLNIHSLFYLLPIISKPPPKVPGKYLLPTATMTFSVTAKP